MFKFSARDMIMVCLLFNTFSLTNTYFNHMLYPKLWSRLLGYRLLSVNMSDEISAAGFHLDEFKKVKLLDPVVSKHTDQFIENCKTYTKNVENLENVTDLFITLLTDLGDAVDKEKMLAIGMRNSLKSIAKERDRLQHKLQGVLMEKTMELERLQLEYHSLQLVEVEQQETIEYLSALN